MSRRAVIVLFALGFAALAAAGARLFAGPAGFEPPRDSFEFGLRSWRIVSGAAVGAGLAVAGVALQALLRNPLAAPAVLGLTAGAGFGVTLATSLGVAGAATIAGLTGTSAAALLGSVGALVVVYTLAQRRGVVEPVTLILVGVIVSLIAGAGTVFLQHLMPDRGLAASTRWLFGSIRDDTPRGLIVIATLLITLGVIITVGLGRAMDAASLDDDEAVSVGVRLHGLRLALLALAGTLTAASVVIAGPIGFVGLICPHAVRLLAGPANRVVVIGSALLGAGTIVAADTLVRLIDLGGGRMPIGVLTALLGGPVFVALLRARWVRL